VVTAVVEVCEWWPERDAPATSVSGEGCANPATVSVGTRESWHLCGACAALPRFRRMKRRPLNREATR